MLLHVFQAGNGNKCITYFLSGEIKELKKEKRSEVLSFLKLLSLFFLKDCKVVVVVPV